MSYQSINPQIGFPIPQFSGLVVDTVPRLQPGFVQAFTDNWWGFGEFKYARASAAIRAFGLVAITPVFDAALNSYRFDATEVPNTANLGRALLVAVRSMVLGDYGWFQISGLTIVNSNASVAADSSFGIAAVGQAGAVTAGKQILGARVIAPATTTVIKTNCITVGLTTALTVSNSDGWFVGVYLSGTGVAAGTTVTAISPDGRTVTMSAASTAAITGNVTATYNNAVIFYNVVHIGRSIAQGQIV